MREFKVGDKVKVTDTTICNCPRAYKKYENEVATITEITRSNSYEEKGSKYFLSLRFKYQKANIGFYDLEISLCSPIRYKKEKE